jgi:hypothetical protein
VVEETGQEIDRMGLLNPLPKTPLENVPMKTVSTDLISMDQLREIALTYPVETMFGLATAWMIACLWLTCRN